MTGQQCFLYGNVARGKRGNEGPRLDWKIIRVSLSTGLRGARDLSCFFFPLRASSRPVLYSQETLRRRSVQVPASPRVVYRRKLDNRQELLDELRQVIAHPSVVLHGRTIASRRKQYTRARIMVMVLYILTLITLAIERRCLLLHYTSRISLSVPQILSRTGEPQMHTND